MRDTQREFLFGQDAKTSVRWPGAAVARRPARSALLALGSIDRDRFHPGMSTEFLARMAELITDAVSLASRRVS